MAKGFHGLLFVPGTLGPELVHDGKQPVKGRQLIFSGIHREKFGQRYESAFLATSLISRNFKGIR
jgi:hypothetical protein